jgi:hypothetical protein
MSLVSGSSRASLAQQNGAPVITGLFAGENLKAAAPCYVKSDGKVWECVGTSGSAASAPFGFTARQANTDEPVTLYGAGAVFQYGGTTLTPGAQLYLSASDAGLLDTARQIGDKDGVAVAIDAKNIMVTRADARRSTEI